jgi:hypothetical protein
MPIKTSCNCGFAFAVKDEFAGKRVKCPKCSALILIPGSPQVSSPAVNKPPSIKTAVQEATRVVRPGVTVGSGNAKPTLSSPPRVERKAQTVASDKVASNKIVWNRSEKFNPVLDLLDDAGVKRVTTGPTCPQCDAEISPTAIICVHCGFNKETGERLETFSDIKNENAVSSTFVETDTDLLLAQAERDIKNAPNSALNQDFGDGSDSIVVALGALLGFGLIIVAGVLTVLIMDRLAQQANPALISLVTSSVLVAGCYLYLTYTAFRTSVLQGIFCAATVVYCVIFAFMQGRSLILYGMIMSIALIIASVSGFIYFS